MYLTENWRLKEQRYTLTGIHLDNNAVSFPPREVEPRPVEVFDFVVEADYSPELDTLELAKAV